MTLDYAALIETLAEALSKAKTAEILPGDYEQWETSGITPEFPFLLSEGHLGVPKKVLYQTYLCAIPNFFACKSRRAQSPHHDRGLLASTSIIIFVNSAHQTALNARKMLVRSGRYNAKAELDFLAAIITGVRETAKQSVIWHHRRWMLQFIHSPSPTARSMDSESAQLDIPLQTLQAELTLVSHSCEVYPRNYYAWTHRMYCMGILEHLIGSEVPGAVGLLQREFSSALSWIDLHPSDYTAMHYVCRLVLRFQARLQFSSLFEHATSLLETYPDCEALRMYLQNVTRSTAAEDGG